MDSATEVAARLNVAGDVFRLSLHIGVDADLTIPGVVAFGSVHLSTADPGRAPYRVLLTLGSLDVGKPYPEAVGFGVVLIAHG